MLKWMRLGLKHTSLLLSSAVWLACTGGQVPQRGDPRPCPAGSVRHGEPPPVGRAQWCRRRQAGSWVNHGPFMAWHPNGRMQAKGTYRDGKPHGRFEMWFQNGQRRARGHYEQGQKEGVWRSWHMRGGLAIEATFADDEENGPWRSWWQEGYLSAQGQMQDGWESGYWVFWHTNGRLAQAGHYSRGNRTGWWERWERSGEPLPMLRFEDGDEVASGALSGPLAAEDLAQGVQTRPWGAPLE